MGFTQRRRLDACCAGWTISPLGSPQTGLTPTPVQRHRNIVLNGYAASCCHLGRNYTAHADSIV